MLKSSFPYITGSTTYLVENNLLSNGVLPYASIIAGILVCKVVCHEIKSFHFQLFCLHAFLFIQIIHTIFCGDAWFSRGFCCLFFAFRSMILPSCLVLYTSRVMVALIEYKRLSGAIGWSLLNALLSEIIFLRIFCNYLIKFAVASRQSMLFSLQLCLYISYSGRTCMLIIKQMGLSHFVAQHFQPLPLE